MHKNNLTLSRLGYILYVQNKPWLKKLVKARNSRVRYSRVCHKDKTELKSYTNFIHIVLEHRYNLFLKKKYILPDRAERIWDQRKTIN